MSKRWRSSTKTIVYQRELIAHSDRIAYLQSVGDGQANVRAVGAVGAAQLPREQQRARDVWRRDHDRDQSEQGKSAEHSDSSTEQAGCTSLAQPVHTSALYSA